MRGILILSVGVVLVIIGVFTLDNSYELVESIMKIKHNLIDDNALLPNQSVKSIISNDKLVEHNVLLAHVRPASDSIRLIATDPNNETFEKESKNGFVYHIIEKNSQATGNYSVTIYNLSNEPVSVTALIGEDPYLSGRCDPSYITSCYAIPMAIGFVIVGAVAFIVGVLLLFTGLRKVKLRK